MAFVAQSGKNNQYRMRLLLLCFLTFCALVPSSAQIGGKTVFGMLALPQTARLTALGNGVLVVKEDDLGVGLVNPSLLNPANHQSLAFSHEFLPAKIQHGYFGYGHHAKKWRTTFQGAIQYVNYGEFVAADEFGNQTGTFRASDYAVVLGAGHQLSNHLSVGCNAKVVIGSKKAELMINIRIDFIKEFFMFIVFYFQNQD